MDIDKTDLLLIDLSHLFRTHWHATEGQEVGEAFSRTVEQVNRLAPGYPLVAVACDAPPYRRCDISADYKAQRQAPPPMLAEQLRRTEERLKADGFLLWKVPGYEADDVIATAVYRAARDEPPLSVTIASNDKDLLQLVSDATGVRALHPMSGALLTEKDVLAKMGVPPRLLADSLALQGDKSDNIAGIPGCGPVNAAKFLEKFGSLEGLLQGYRTIENERWRKLIGENVDRARLARRLVSLCDDAPIDWDAVFAKRERQPLVESSPFDAEFSEDEPSDDEGLNVLGPPPAVRNVTHPDPDGENTVRTVRLGEAAIETQGEESAAGEAPRAKVLRPEAPKSTALALAPVEFSMQLEPQSIGGAYKLAEGLYNSRLYSRFSSAEAIWAIIIRGREMGLGALTALDMFHMIEGKPAMHAHLIIALCKKDPDCEYFQYKGGDDTFAEYETKHRREPEPTKLRYDIEQAERAGLLAKKGSNWVRIPAEMLRKMAGVQLGRVVYPGAAMGVYAVEELE